MNFISVIEILCGVDFFVVVFFGGEFFFCFISFIFLEYFDYFKCKKIMIEWGEFFFRRILLLRNKIVDLCYIFIKDGVIILIYVYFRVVLRVLEVVVVVKK